MEDEVLTIKEVANYLKMNERTIYKLVQSGKLPAAKIASQWRLKKDLIKDWLEYQMNQLEAHELAGLDEDDQKEVVSIASLLSKDCVKLNLQSNSKSQLLKELVDLMVNNGAISKGEEFLHALIERERLCSTAISDEVAMPHPRQAPKKLVKKPKLAVGISKKGIDFESADDKPTRLFFLICAPREDIHLKIMARLSRLLRDPKLRYDLIQSDSFEKFLSLIQEGEKQLA